LLAQIGHRKTASLLRPQLKKRIARKFEQKKGEKVNAVSTLLPTALTMVFVIGQKAAL